MEHVLVVNGFEKDDPQEERVLGLLTRALADRGERADRYVAREHRLIHCIGCFECFTTRPGLCRLRDDGDDVARGMAAADVLVVVGRSEFGTWSSAAKRYLDRILPVLLPDFFTKRGESHHPARYPLPRFVTLGVSQAPDPLDAQLFTTLAGRIALNLTSPSFAGELLDADGTDDLLLARIRDTLAREDPWPWHERTASLNPPPHPRDEVPRTGHALLLQGSPKIGPSTSAVLGNELLDQLRSRGWTGAELRLTAALRKESGRAELFEAASAADLIVLATPLYVDTLHTLSILALETLAQDPARWGAGPEKGLVVLANNGLPESFQNALLIGACERFAARTALRWDGGLALGAGEGLVGGMPLRGPERARRAPVDRVLRGFARTADALAAGRGVPAEAQRDWDRSPIPIFPGGVWRALYRRMGTLGWRREGRKNGLSKRALAAQPFGRTASRPSRGTA